MREIGVVVQVGIQVRDAVLGGGEQAAASIRTRPPQVRAHEFQRPVGRRAEFRLVQGTRRDRQSADRERIPAGEYLVVQPWPDSAAADGQ
jgi:hypothetical protein